MEIRAVIIDDEDWSRESLAGMLNLYVPEVKIIGTADSVTAGRKILRENDPHPHIIFLDIEMPNGSGFDLIDEIDLTHSEIIVITAHDSYAIRAFKASALDFLLKPISKDDLLSAIERYKLRTRTFPADMKKLLRENLAAKNGDVKRLLIPSYEGFDVVAVDKIMYCEANRNYTTFYLTTEEIITASKTLKEYESILSPGTFVRVHQKYLVNINFIQKYLKGRSGTLIMTNGKNIAVAENRKSDLINLLQGS